MTDFHPKKLLFDKKIIKSKLITPDGIPVDRKIEIRINPVTGRKCRITFCRSAEKEQGTRNMPPVPPNAKNKADCPFCHPQYTSRTPRLDTQLNANGRLFKGDSVLFPNLFPYCSYSAVSLFDDNHFVEIGTASCPAYTNSFINCKRYLEKILKIDEKAIYMAITQNHLPSAGGSLIHPHLQVHADRIASNHHGFIKKRANTYHKLKGSYLFTDYLRHEKKDKQRYIGKTGEWEWVAAFAPEGFYEIWGILPGITRLTDLSEERIHSLSQGILNCHKFYRNLNRNGYNLGLLMIEDGISALELRVVIMVRSNYAPWVRNDHTGFEVMLGDMATFVAPEETASSARIFFKKN